MVKLNATSLLDHCLIREHFSLSASTGKHVNSSIKSAVKDLCLFFNRVGLLEEFSILTYESHPFKFLIKEFLMVSRDKALFKQTSKINPLQLF